MNISENCHFCPKSLDEGEVVKLRATGCKNINRIINSQAEKLPEVHIGQVVHVNCRRDFIRRPDCLVINVSENHSEDSNVNDICFFCGCPAKLTAARKRGIDVYTVKKASFIENVNKTIILRNDEWALEVKNRIGCRNLLNANYHKMCSVNFQNNKNIPLRFGISCSKKVGRPENKCKSDAFLKLVEHMLSNVGRIFSIKELVEIIQQECEEEIENRYVKKKLTDHFGDDIMVVSNEGKPDLFVLSQSFKTMINQMYEQQTLRNGETEKNAIISTSANYIKSDVMKIPPNKSIYPTSDTLSDLKEQINYLPKTLHNFLDTIFVEANRELKIASIGQAIIQAVRPRTVIAPLQLGLGVQVHHTYKSKFIVETLHKMGFSSSYPEVKKFKFCAAATIEEIHPNPGQVVKFVADNIDHDARTINGKGTFHGMGMIAAITPGNGIIKPIVRSNATIADVRAIGQANILPYSKKLTGNGLSYQKLSECEYDGDFIHTELLLKMTWSLRSSRPSWSGIMQMINHDSHSGDSKIKILPMIDLNPSDPSCIYSTLYFLCQQAKRYEVTPKITFDQPLWWKATLIIQNEPVSSILTSIVLILGGFHMQMSFLGSIGHLMTGTGLQECLETVYAPNSVIHMLSGKSIQRAIRGHFLVDTALNALLIKKGETMFPELDWRSLLAKAADIYDRLISLEINSKDLQADTLLLLLMSQFIKIKTKLKEHRTAKVWIQYMEMVDLLRDFIRGERTGNWKLHLSTVRKMIPYFAAAGHHNYAKTAYLYLQQMEQLQKTHPDVFEHFMNGHHVIRRSDRFWAGLSCDLTVEQTLMRAAKSRAGFTRGGGSEEDQRMVWIQSMPACAEYNIAMQKITDLYYETSEQHKDCSKSRKIRDEKDTKIIYDFLEDRDPFSLDEVVLRSIYTGEEAQPNVNIDSATSIGLRIISKMIGKVVSEHSFENADKAITMGSNNSILVDGEIVHIDPQLLFQRIMLMARNFDDEKLKQVFEYELSQKPSSLFDDSGLMREAKTNDFVHQFIATTDTQIAPEKIRLITYRYVLCGTFLLNRIPWKKSESFHNICLLYLEYVMKFERPVIVFDCVPEGTTKDEFYFRQSKGIRGVNTKFTEGTLFNSKKEHFLANRSNRDSFLAMLSKMLTEKGCTILQAKTDQNLLIAKTATEMAMTDPVMVIGDDLEVIILLCYRAQPDCYDVVFKSEEGTKKASIFYSIERIRERHGEDVVKNLYFIHAIGGCKTTSHLHTIGKGTILKVFNKFDEFRSISTLFANENSSIPQIVEAGNRALAMIYNGTVDESLDLLRFKQFSKKVATKKSAVLVNSLSPTTGAAKYHVLRVFLQVQQWLENVDLNVENFGWSKNQKYKPKTTDLNAAPPELLKSIRCQCKGSCSNLRCSCFKNNAKCSAACGVCRGTNCLNICAPDETDNVIDD